MNALIALLILFVGVRALGGALRARRPGRSPGRELYDRRLRAGPSA